MTVPTSGEVFSKLIENLRMAQENAATLAHLENANDNRKLATGWLAVSEWMKRVQESVTALAMRRMN